MISPGLLLLNWIINLFVSPRTYVYIKCVFIIYHYLKLQFGQLQNMLLLIKRIIYQSETFQMRNVYNFLISQSQCRTSLVAFFSFFTINMSRLLNREEAEKNCTLKHLSVQSIF